MDGTISWTLKRRQTNSRNFDQIFVPGQTCCTDLTVSALKAEPWT